MRLVKKIRNVFLNAWYILCGIVVGRSKKNILFGAWGGQNFSDNPRFLFQYLFENKNELGLDTVIWATRNEKVKREMEELGYSCVLIGTEESKYWHLKCGVHILNNATDEMPRLEPDIDVKYSAGAKRLQLWHGVGIKACSRLQKNAKELSWLRKKYVDNISFLFQLGMWKKCYFLATSEENKRVAIHDYGINEKRIIVANYPRLCDCPRLNKDEEDIVSFIKQLRDRYKIILYLPTFREDYSSYVDPNRIEGFNDFLAKNSFIWIQKAHNAERSVIFSLEEQNIISLESKFDINLIYKYVDMVISDYSSATSDAIANDVMTVDYCPDLDYYENKDRGFVAPFESYHIGNLVLNPDMLFETIKRFINVDPLTIKKHNMTKAFLFEHSDMDLSDIFHQIRMKMNI